PGSADAITGCDVAFACLVAWRFGELSQQSVPPHVWQVRRCTHVPPIFTHSSQTRFFACLTDVTASMCAHAPPSLIAPAPSDPIYRGSRRHPTSSAGSPPVPDGARATTGRLRISEKTPRPRPRRHSTPAEGGPSRS